MAGGGNAIRGSRVGAGPMGEAERGEAAPRQAVTYFCSHGHRSVVTFAVEAAVPDSWDCPRCGLPASLDSENPPPAPKIEPYKTHLAYVKERRSDAEAETILDEALQLLRSPPQVRRHHLLTRAVERVSGHLAAARCSELRGGVAVEEPDRLVRRRVTPAAGQSWRSVPSARARATASAFSVAADQEPHRSARFRAAKVRLIRSGGGLGEPVTATAIGRRRRAAGSRGTARRRGRRGRCRASARRTRRCRDSRSVSRVRRRAGLDVGGVGGRGHLVHPGGVDPTRVEEAARAWPALRSGESGATKRSSPHQMTTRDQSTSERRGEPGQLAVDGVGDGAAGQPDLRHLAGRLRVDQPAAARPATAVASASADSCDLDPRRSRRSAACIFVSVRAAAA